MPVGGRRRVRSVEDARALLRPGRHGLDQHRRVEDPELISRARTRSAHSVCLRHRRRVGARAALEVFHTAAARPPAWMSSKYASRGRTRAGEILLTSMDRDGARPATTPRSEGDHLGGRWCRDRLGRAGNAADLVAAVKDGGADAVLAASIFHFGDQHRRGRKRAMADAGLPMRLS